MPKQRKSESRLSCPCGGGRRSEVEDRRSKDEGGRSSGLRNRRLQAAGCGLWAVGCAGYFFPNPDTISIWKRRLVALYRTGANIKSWKLGLNTNSRTHIYIVSPFSWLRYR